MTQEKFIVTVVRKTKSQLLPESIDYFYSYFTNDLGNIIRVVLETEMLQASKFHNYGAAVSIIESLSNLDTETAFPMLKDAVYGISKVWEKARGVSSVKKESIKSDVLTGGSKTITSRKLPPEAWDGGQLKTSSGATEKVGLDELNENKVERGGAVADKQSWQPDEGIVFPVKITKAGKPTYWYADKIGETFLVTILDELDFKRERKRKDNEGEGSYTVVNIVSNNNDGAHKPFGITVVQGASYIGENDCEIVLLKVS